MTDPPLYDALRALHGLGPRHLLREDHVLDVHSHYTVDEVPEAFPDPTVYGLPPDHVYASDDDLAGPPSPPLGDVAPEPGVQLVRCACGEQIVQVRGG